MRVVYVSAELTPYASTGGLGDVAAALPAALRRRGIDLLRLIPLYRSLRSAVREGRTLYSCLVPLVSRSVQARIVEIRTGDNVPTAAVDIPEYFDRAGLYGDSHGDYADNAERFIAFQKAVLSFLSSRSQSAEVLHCNDWHTALVPVLIHAARRGWHGGFFRADIARRTLLTIHNLAYQGIFPREAFPLTGLPDSYFHWKAMEFYGNLNLLKGGIVFADIISTVSPTYAREIQEPRFGCGLHGVLRDRRAQLFGILNGVDYSVWDPGRDRFLPARYSAANLRGKWACKAALLHEFGLRPRSRVPLLGMVSRLVEQKGLDVLDSALALLRDVPFQMVLLGTGEPRYEKMCRDWIGQYPSRIAVRIAFDHRLAHRIEAAADIYVMPSLFEPCGLNQLYSLRYGAVPVVHDTGGL
ncbi:MAG TPA: glycogen synthase, partial [Lentisphaerae bacterium]|nr:glycogen synthase [Lentisphaerota bacterium]